jgi:hypothetical protein
MMAQRDLEGVFNAQRTDAQGFDAQPQILAGEAKLKT